MSEERSPLLSMHLQGQTVRKTKLGFFELLFSVLYKFREADQAWINVYWAIKIPATNLPPFPTYITRDGPDIRPCLYPVSGRKSCSVSVLQFPSKYSARYPVSGLIFGLIYSIQPDIWYPARYMVTDQIYNWVPTPDILSGGQIFDRVDIWSIPTHHTEYRKNVLIHVHEKKHHLKLRRQIAKVKR